MIPKILHFIWIGIKPLYLNNVITAYKKYNSCFKINLVYYSEHQLYNLYFNKNIKTDIDKICYQLIYALINKNKYQELLSQQIIQLSKSGNIPFIQIFCDILRLELLNIFGGLYIDCDTYPIKSFDDKILNHSRILVFDKISEVSVYPNNYFIGSIPNTNWSNYFDGSADKFIQINNQQLVNLNKIKPFDYHIRRIKFFNGTLTDNDMKTLLTENGDYFEHYSEFRWGRNKVPFTKFDEIFKC